MCGGDHKTSDQEEALEIMLSNAIILQKGKQGSKSMLLAQGHIASG